MGGSRKYHRRLPRQLICRLTAPAAWGTGIGTLGGSIGLGGSQFRLPVLIGLFRFVALEASILNKAMSRRPWLPARLTSADRTFPRPGAPREVITKLRAPLRLALDRPSIRVVFYVSIAVRGIRLHRPVQALWDNKVEFFELLPAVIQVIASVERIVD